MISKPCTQAELESPAFRTWASAMKEPFKFNRKLWEFCYIAEALEQAGMLVEGKKGLGFGVGKEPLSALFASRGCRVVATDQEEGGGWSSTNQHATELSALNERGICNPEKFIERVTFQPVDMRMIPRGLRDFDFLWSSCAFEHLGSLQAGLTFVERSLACLKPGGVAVHTTEYNCSSNDGTVETWNLCFYRRRDLEKLAERLKVHGYGVEMSFALGEGDLDRKVVHCPEAFTEEHLKLGHGEYVTTSYGISIGGG